MRFNLVQIKTPGSTGNETPLCLNSKAYAAKTGMCFNPFHDILSNAYAVVNDMHHHYDIQNQIYTKEDQVVYGANGINVQTDINHCDI